MEIPNALSRPAGVARFATRSALARARSALALALLALLGGTPEAAQSKSRDLPKNDPSNCPYCGGDEELMKAAGIVSHGGFDFGRTDTGGADELLSDTDIYWIETDHFTLGFGLDAYKLATDERGKIRGELTRLSERLPGIQPRDRVLDPWLRTHLYAQRLTELWARMLTILQVEDTDFPDGPIPWLIGQPYWGEGRHMGQPAKFEVLVLPNQNIQDVWLTKQYGLQTKSTQIWNIPERGALTVVMNGQDERLRRDGALHGHIAYNCTLNILGGYKFYAYRTPIWLSQGLAHLLERDLDPQYNSFSYSEGSLADKTRRTDWWGQVKKLVQSEQAPRIAELVHLRTAAQFELTHHFVAWSMTDFLLERFPTGYACLNSRLHGIKNEQGLNDGSHMKDRHREFFQECIGLRYDQFDEAWADWAVRQRMPARASARMSARGPDRRMANSASLWAAMPGGR